MGNSFISLGWPWKVKNKQFISVGRAIDLSIMGEDEVSITLRYRNSKARAVLGGGDTESRRNDFVTKRPHSSLVLYDEKKKVVWPAP